MVFGLEGDTSPAKSSSSPFCYPISNSRTPRTMRALAGQAEGFGRHAIGGLHGRLYHVTGNGLQLRGCEHVIICNLEFEGGRGDDVDAIQIKPKSRHIWIDRCSLHDYSDGLIDITCESTDITVSR
ncbi:hypothetical protein B296_00055471 [Ensete ventricosum]|uniref:Pectate lyase n=1 Tax=Ensete ventricosum TaxID=4639 RepID=A0A426Y018_ENSVE|nr:hypothetical protein B296_00055471 [Ensete ventricosum]